MPYLKVYENGSFETHGVHSGLTLEEYIKDCIASGTGSSYDREPQHLEAKVERTNEAIGKLLSVLRMKNLLTDSEVLEVVGMGDWEVNRDKVVIKLIED